jgi:hypothetical protein
VIRVVVETCDAGMAANVGGSVHREIRTFDIEATALEAFLREPGHSLQHRQVIGVEIIAAAKAQP